jgi:hypothetical protein
MRLRGRVPQEPDIPSLSLIEAVYCSVVLVLGYSLRGSTGFGAAAATPLLSLVVPIKVLVPAWTVLSLVAAIAGLPPGLSRHSGKPVKMLQLANGVSRLVQRPGTNIATTILPGERG